MITRYRISLNGTQLDQLLVNDYGQNALVITNVGCVKPSFDRTVETPASRDGGIVTKTYRGKATVIVSFMLRIYDVAQRNAACQRIKTWAAAGGYIRINDRNNQTLYNAVCDEYPEIDSARDWTEILTMSFSSYVFPYWQDTNQTAFSGTGTNITGTLKAPGNAPKAYVTVEITPQSGTLAEVEISVGSTKIKVSGMSITTSGKLVIDYDARMNIRIRRLVGSTYTSYLEKRTTDSTDELLAVPGASSSVSIKTTNSIRVKADLKVRGAWI